MGNFNDGREELPRSETFDFNSSLLEVMKDILLALRRIEAHLQAASDEDFDDEDVGHGDT